MFKTITIRQGADVAGAAELGQCSADTYGTSYPIGETAEGLTIWRCVQDAAPSPDWIEIKAAPGVEGSAEDTRLFVMLAGNDPIELTPAQWRALHALTAADPLELLAANKLPAEVGTAVQQWYQLPVAAMRAWAAQHGWGAWLRLSDAERQQHIDRTAERRAA